MARPGASRRVRDNGAMDWIRDNLRLIVIIVVAAMALPFLLTLAGIVAF